MRKILKSFAVAALTFVLLSSTALATMYQGRKEIAATGTAVAIYASSQVVDWVSLYAPTGNEGPLYIGSSTVTYTGATTDGRLLVPGAVMDLRGCNLNNVYINGLDNDAVYFVASTESLGWLYSGEKGVATTAIKASAGVLHGVLIETDGTNSVTVQLYDHASTATNPITPSIVVAGGDLWGGMLGIDAICLNGIVLVLSGTNGVATVLYK